LQEDLASERADGGTLKRMTRSPKLPRLSVNNVRWRILFKALRSGAVIPRQNAGPFYGKSAFLFPDSPAAPWMTAEMSDHEEFSQYSYQVARNSLAINSTLTGVRTTVLGGTDPEILFPPPHGERDRRGRRRNPPRRCCSRARGGAADRKIPLGHYAFPRPGSGTLRHRYRG
jgi:hypothetical protein